MSDTEITVQPGHQHNVKRSPASKAGTYIRDPQIDLKPGEKLIHRTGGSVILPPPGAKLIQPGHQRNFRRPPGTPGYTRDTPTTLPKAAGHWIIVQTGAIEEPPPEEPPVEPPPVDPPVEEPPPGHESPEPPTPPPGSPPPPLPGSDQDGTSTAGAFGIALLPVRAGMKVAAYTNFDEETRTLGQGFGPRLSQIWRPRPDAARDGTYKDSSGRGTYSVKATFEQKDSLARFFIHSGSAGNSTVHDPNGPINYVYAPLDQQNDQSELFVQFTCKFPQIPGRKMAHLLWRTRPESNGEIDIPEGKLDGGADKGNMFVHHYMSSQQDSVRLHLSLQQAHHFGTYFRRKGANGASDPGEIIGYVDGKQIYHSQSAVGIPTGMHWVGQFETYLKGQDIPTSNKGSGWAEYDKYRFDVKA